MNTDQLMPPPPVDVGPVLTSKKRPHSEIEEHTPKRQSVQKGELLGVINNIHPRKIVSPQTEDYVKLIKQAGMILTPQTVFSQIYATADGHLHISASAESFPDIRMKQIKNYQAQLTGDESMIQKIAACFLIKGVPTTTSEKITFSMKRLFKEELEFFFKTCPGHKIECHPVYEDNVVGERKPDSPSLVRISIRK